jgi:hypothetical protein
MTDSIYEEKVYVWTGRHDLQELLDAGWSVKLGVAQSIAVSGVYTETNIGDVIFILRRPKPSKQEL